MWHMWGFGKKVAEAINYLEHLGLDAMITLKCILRTQHESALDSVTSEQDPGAGSCEYHNEPFCSAKSGGSDQLRNYYLLKKH